MDNSGAYRLFLQLDAPARIRVRALGERVLHPGRYVYVGSARRNLSQRIPRVSRMMR
jgi:sugar fermentation stimulation protein A